MGVGTVVAVGNGVGVGAAIVGCTGTTAGSGVAVGAPGKQAARASHISANIARGAADTLTLRDTLIISAIPYCGFAISYDVRPVGDLPGVTGANK